MATERVLLIAQSPVLRYGIRTVLQDAIALELVTEASGALEAAGCVRDCRPTLIVIHDALPGVTGDVAAAMLRDLQPDARIVLLSDDASESHIVAAVRHGADALLSMAIDPGGFSAAVETIAGRPRSPVLGIRQAEPDSGSACSAQELAILDGIVRGLDTPEIARRLQATDDLVDRETTALLRKLSAVDRPALVMAAIRCGLIDLHDQLPVLPGASEFGIESAA